MEAEAYLKKENDAIDKEYFIILINKIKIEDKKESALKAKTEIEGKKK